MKYASELTHNRIAEIRAALPGLDEELTETDTALVIGASCIMFYADQGWIPPTQRQTGDLDIALRLKTTEISRYAELKERLKRQGYDPDPDMSYRLYSPKRIPGAINYVDLLLIPSSNCAPGIARAQMGVGDGFSFEGFELAYQGAHPLTTTLALPTVFGFLALKRSAYLDEPGRRIKDLADVIEVAAGLVRQGHHFDLHEIWQAAKPTADGQLVYEALQAIASDRSTTWDIGNAAHELRKRGFSTEDTEENFLREIQELVEQLGRPIRPTGLNALDIGGLRLMDLQTEKERDRRRERKERVHQPVHPETLRGPQTNRSPTNEVDCRTSLEPKRPGDKPDRSQSKIMSHSLNIKAGRLMPARYPSSPSRLACTGRGPSTRFGRSGRRHQATSL